MLSLCQPQEGEDRSNPLLPPPIVLAASLTDITVQTSLNTQHLHWQNCWPLHAKLFCCPVLISWG